MNTRPSDSDTEPTMPCSRRCAETMECDNSCAPIKRVRHSCDTDMLSDCPGCEAEHARALQDIPKPDDPVEGVEDVDAMVAELKEMAVPQPFGTVMYVELDEAISLLRRLAAKPQERADENAVVYQSMSTEPDTDDDGNEYPDDGTVWMDVSKDDYYRLLDHPGIRSRILYTKPHADQDRKDAVPKLIGWRTDNYLMETSDLAVAKNWECHYRMLPIFEGDPNTKLDATMAQEAGNG